MSHGIVIVAIVNVDLTERVHGEVISGVNIVGTAPVELQVLAGALRAKLRLNSVDASLGNPHNTVDMALGPHIC